MQWRGATHRLCVDVAGHRVTADVRELHETPLLGSEVTLHFAARDAVVLPATATPVGSGGGAAHG